jgi:uncharacterized protein YecE (DUF72 family)
MKESAAREFKPYLRVGTCSWKYDSWKGLYYETGKKYSAEDYLPDYAKHLDTVEVDQWFWSLFPGAVRLPDARTVKTYAESVPDDFIFTVKAPNSITLTHYYSRQPAKHAEYAGKPNEHFLDNGLMERFLESLAPLGKKLGPVMFQFEYLNKKKMPSRQAFQDRLHDFIEKAPREFQYAVEARNPNYLNSAYFDFLEEHELGHVYLEGYYMPPIAEVFTKHRPETAGFSIIRLHGGDRLEIEAGTGKRWDRVVAPKPEGLAAAARIVRANRKKKILTFVNVNNHYEGSAPVTIERFQEELFGSRR